MEDITGLQLGAFEYTTVQAMRRLGLAKVDAGDARVRELIREKSQIVNDMTEQWFVPVEGQPLLTGRESAVLPMPNMIPLLEVLNLRVINRGYDDATGFDLPRVEYVIQPRYIELVNIVFKRATVYSSLSSDVDPTGSSRVTRGVGQVFSPVPQAIKITGAFGWLEERKVTKFATTTTADIVGGTLDNADLSVFMMYRSDGYSCTAELIQDDPGGLAKALNLPLFDPNDKNARVADAMLASSALSFPTPTV